MDTGFKTAGTVEATGGWSYCTVARLASDDSSRTMTSLQSYTVFQLSDFDFGIPADSTIDGIEVNFQLRTTYPWTRAYAKVGLSWDDGSSWTDYSTARSTISTTDQSYTEGGATSEWDRTWDDLELADGTFQLRLAGYTTFNFWGNAQVDLVRVKVYYTIAGSTSPSASPSASPSVSVSMSPSRSPSVSRSASPSASVSVSPSASPSVSVSVSPSVSQSFSPSVSRSGSPSISPSVSPSPAPQSESPSASPSISLSASPSISPSVSSSESISVSPSVESVGVKIVPKAKIDRINPRSKVKVFRVKGYK